MEGDRGELPFICEVAKARSFVGSAVEKHTMKMAWQPQEEGLRQIITLLKESQSPDTATQQAVQLVSFFIIPFRAPRECPSPSSSSSPP